MALRDLVQRNRSYRRFDAARPVEAAVLEDLVALARCTASAANRQPLKYVLSSAADWNGRIFDTLAWAAYLPEWPGPSPSERPTAYIVILLDTNIAKAAEIDVGIVAQTILLGAVEKGLGGCMFLNIRKEALARTLDLPGYLGIALVIALGWPVERVMLEDCPAAGSIKYYRDAEATHHVPKRVLGELIHARYS